MFKNFVFNYMSRYDGLFNEENISNIEHLCSAILETHKTNNRIFIYGNGGSAGNAVHLANDFIYGAGKKIGRGFNIESLSSNPAVITCLANDVSYDDIYSEQLKVKGKENDISIALSGSGNSRNIIKALDTSNELNMKTFAILGYDGGKSKEKSLYPIHFNIQDMQISEDLQLIVGHICMQWLCEV